MSTQARANLAAFRAAVAKLFRVGAVVLVPVIAGGAAGCRDAPAPPVVTGPHPADAAAPAPAVRYRSTIGSYTSRRPVEPAPWGEQKERAAPQSEPAR
jgi:hypothetical protein